MTPSYTFWPIPAGADSTSTKHIEQMKRKLGHMVISPEEIQFIIDGIMKAQMPRDQERIQKKAEKDAEKARRKAALAAMQRAS